MMYATVTDNSDDEKITFNVDEFVFSLRSDQEKCTCVFLKGGLKFACKEKPEEIFDHVTETYVEKDSFQNADGIPHCG